MVDSSKNPSTARNLLLEVMSGGPMRALLAIVLGFLVGSVFIVSTDEAFQSALGYFFSRPSDALVAAAAAIGAGFVALFEGSIYNGSSNDFVTATRPITETLRLSAPLILAGLGIALGFRVGLFNIGGTGQLLAGAAGAAFVSTKFELPVGLHLLFAILAAVAAAALWGGIVGFLKARTGAHEVIVTIMMNYIALSLVTWMMRTPGILQDPEVSGQPKTAAPFSSAQLPALLGNDYALHAGLLMAVAATFFYWWFMERSVLGFTFRMVGKNEAAARVAGVNVNRTYILAMAFSAGFVGLAAANQALGRSAGFPPSLHGGIGFDAITVALLGGGSATGVFLAGLLFGAFKAAGPSMQIAGIAPEVLLIVQGSIVLFIAAPPLIRAIFRLPAKKPPLLSQVPGKNVEAEQ